MHIHGNSMSVQAANFYSAAQENRTAASQRAADVRRKLLKSATEIDSSASPEETLMIGQWLDSRHSQVLTGDENHAAVEGKDPDFG